MKTQPLWKTLAGGIVVAWENKNLPSGWWLEKIAQQNKRAFRIIFECLALMICMMCLQFSGEDYPTSVQALMAIATFVYGFMLVARVNYKTSQLQELASRFENEAKGLGIDEYAGLPFESVERAVKNQLIIAAENFLKSEKEFEFRRKQENWSWEKLTWKGNETEKLKKEYKRLLGLAFSFGLATGDWNEHFGPAREALEKNVG